MGVENEGFENDRNSQIQLEDSFMFDVAGHIKNDLYDMARMQEVYFTVFHRVPNFFFSFCLGTRLNYIELA